MNNKHHLFYYYIYYCYCIITSYLQLSNILLKSTIKFFIFSNFISAFLPKNINFIDEIILFFSFKN